MTKQKGIGLAEVIYRDLARLEEKTKKEQPERGRSTQNLNQVTNLQG
jgi:Rod binding domain-containing protein